MRLIDADELIEHVWSDRLHTRELIAQMIKNAPTVRMEDVPKEVEKKIHDFVDGMYRMGKDDGYKKGVEDTKAQVQKAYEDGFDNGYNDGTKEPITHEKAIDFLEETGWKDAHDKEMIEHGMNIAWEYARKIICDCNYPHNHLRMFVVKGDTLVKFFTENTATEAIAKIKEYEEKQKQKDDVRVGDEVTSGGCTTVITFIGKDFIQTIDAYGALYIHEFKDEGWRKTGKHYSQIEEVMKELRGDEDADSN